MAEKSLVDTSNPTLTIGSHLQFGGRATILCVAWLPGERIVTASDDSIARIWDLTNDMQVGSSMDHKSPIADIVTTQDGRIVSCCPKLQHLKVWNADTQEPVDGPWSNDHVHGSPEHIYMSPHEELLASCHAERIVFWDMVGMMRVRNYIHIGARPLRKHARTSAARFSPDGMRFAVAFFQEQLAVFDVESGEGIFTPLIPLPDWDRETTIHDIAWSPDGARLFCGRQDGEIHCFDARTVESIGTPWKAHSLRVRALSFSPDGKRLASAGGDGTARCWDVESGNPVGKSLRHTLLLMNTQRNMFRFSPSGEYFACAERSLWMWRVPWWDNGDSAKALNPSGKSSPHR